jgi:sterol desaturase/sphingolipid hydroxylase (fatty acid hydroxylase superfamily)
MTATAPTPDRTRAGSTTLGEEFRFFCSQTNPKIQAATLVLALAARLAVGDWGYGDAVIVAVLLGIQPFFEWVFHVYVLHYRPIRLFGRTIDFELARKHREHHEDPTVVELIFVPLRSLLIATVVIGALYLLLFPTLQGALTAMATSAAMLLVYEWTHYLIHSRYRPKSRLFRYIWRAHRLHHYKNEQYWFGVTNPAADHVLRTFPSPSDVETSPTARDLNAR